MAGGLRETTLPGMVSSLWPVAPGGWHKKQVTQWGRRNRGQNTADFIASSCLGPASSKADSRTSVVWGLSRNILARSRSAFARAGRCCRHVSQGRERAVRSLGRQMRKGENQTESTAVYKRDRKKIKAKPPCSNTCIA